MALLTAQPGAQTKFLSCPADVVFYGGAAGGGKTHALLLEPLRHAHNPLFTAIIFRRLLTEIRKVGGIWDASHKVYTQLSPKCKPKPNNQELTWKFKSGAKIQFAGIESDDSVYSYQSTELCLIAFDELTHFSQHQFFYLLSRNRSVCGVKPYVRATCNPDRDSWVRNFIAWWIDDATGLAIPERSGKIRYFINLPGEDGEGQETIWSDRKEDLNHHFSKRELKMGAGAKSFTFIYASVYDNKKLLEIDPNYISNLKTLNKVERERLLGGNWNISYSDFGTVISRSDFKRYNYESVKYIPGFFKEVYFVLDGASRTKEANDYSVLGLYAKNRVTGEFYIIDWVRKRMQEPDLEQAIIDKWAEWKHLKPIAVNIERGACGISLMQRLPRRGIPVFELDPIKDKFLRLNDVLGIIKNGFVHVPDDATWANKFFEECECFRADMKHALMDREILPHDDQVDNLSYGLGSQINSKVPFEIQTNVTKHKKEQEKIKARINRAKSWLNS